VAAVLRLEAEVAEAAAEAADWRCHSRHHCRCCPRTDYHCPWHMDRPAAYCHSRSPEAVAEEEVVVVRAAVSSGHRYCPELRRSHCFRCKDFRCPLRKGRPRRHFHCRRNYRSRSRPGCRFRSHPSCRFRRRCRFRSHPSCRFRRRCRFRSRFHQRSHCPVEVAAEVAASRGDRQRSHFRFRRNYRFRFRPNSRSRRRCRCRAVWLAVHLAALQRLAAEAEAVEPAPSGPPSSERRRHSRHWPGPLGAAHDR
jgi:hypothetical protein